MNRPLIVAIVGAVVVFIALGLAWLVGQRDYVPDTPPPVTDEPLADPAPVSREDAGSVMSGESEPGAGPLAGSDDAPSTGEEASVVPPSFDVVRVDREGNTVMAGRATPEAEVVIRDGEHELGRVQADERGEWVFLPEEPLAPGTRDLRLATIGPDGAEQPSDTSVVMVVPEPQQADNQPALAVETAPGRPSRVLQAPVPMASAQEDNHQAEAGDVGTPAVVIDVVDYDETGTLSFGGRAAPGATVLGYVDNQFVGQATVGPDGHWSVTGPDPVATGRHTLRADVVTSDGDEIEARAEVPFLRPEGQTLPPEGRLVMVQPGNSLWRIARATLGAGAAYTVIYEANRAQIRDPDLIYPGQVFVVPEEGGR